MFTTLLLCTVIGIPDGDTLRARCSTDRGAETLAIRLAEIDAPERGQRYGRQARQHLAALCGARDRVEIRPAAIDRYGRTVAHVTCRGVDAGTEQVRAGMAWAFDRYATTQSLYTLEAHARQERRGLWADAVPVAPWEWRKRHHHP